MTTITGDTTLAEFLALGATVLCFTPDSGYERSLWQDGIWWYTDDEKSNRGWASTYRSMQEALDALMS